MPNRKEIVDEARSWLGTKWQHQGRTRLGIDCAGLIIVVGTKTGGLTLDYDFTRYQRRPDSHAFMQAFRNNMDRKSLKDTMPGDVLLFKDGAYPCHSAIVGDRDRLLTIIHSYAMQRRVVEDLLSQGPWLKKRVACFEFRGIE